MCLSTRVMNLKRTSKFFSDVYFRFLANKMAAITIRAVKLAVVGGAAIPVIGLSGRLSAASKDDETPQSIRACDIPLYKVIKPALLVAGKSDKDEHNELQRQITKYRILATEVIQNFMNGYETMKSKVETGVDHSKATLNYVQTNPGELPRVGFISVATMGGFVLGYRGGILRKLLFATVAGLSSAALCYPHFTVGLANAVKTDAQELWKENIGWPLSDGSVENTQPKVKKTPKPRPSLTGDQGQSNKEDKDLYSTRS